MAVLFWHALERIHLQPVHGAGVIPLFVHHRREGASNRGEELRVKMILVPLHVAGGIVFPEMLVGIDTHFLHGCFGLWHPVFFCRLAEGAEVRRADSGGHAAGAGKHEPRLVGRLFQ